MKELDRETYARNRPALLASKKFYCETCDRDCGKQNELEKHNNTLNHQRLASEMAAGLDREFSCDVVLSKRVCNFNLRGKEQTIRR